MKGEEREEYARQLHARLLEGDPAAPGDFAEAFLGELVQRLRAKARPSCEDASVRDAATDALLDYVQHPSKFKPNKSALMTYLTMAAYRDLLNSVAKEQRRRCREVPLQVVEETLDQGNNEVEPENGVLDGMTAEKRTELLQTVSKMFPDARDRAFLELMMNGERKTSAFCRVLGIQTLTPDEQRRAVKRHKDRITKRLQRLGGKVNGRR